MANVLITCYGELEGAHLVFMCDEKSDSLPTMARRFIHDNAVITEDGYKIHVGSYGLMYSKGGHFSIADCVALLGMAQSDKLENAIHSGYSSRYSLPFEGVATERVDWC
jgi:hypothetical protein